MDQPLKVGDKIQTQGNVWEIVKIGGGNVYLKNKDRRGVMMVPWIKLADWLFDGRATRVG